MSRRNANDVRGIWTLWRAWLGADPMLLTTVATDVVMDPVQKKENIGSCESLLVATNCVMASPRAFLMSVPMEGTDEWAMIGAVENFPRADGDTEIPVGTRAIFSLSPETEGVWHEGTYGTIETLLTVQWIEVAAPSECDVCAAEGLRDGPVPAKNVKTETGGFGEVAPCPWITIAADGAGDTRNGPSLAYTKVETSVKLAQSGSYCVCGIVSPSVQSLSPRSTEPSTRQDAAAELPAALRVGDTDVALVRGHVVDRLIPGTRPQGQRTAEPDAVYTRPMPAIADTKALSPDEDDWKNSGAGCFSPGVLVAARDRNRAIPF